MKLQAATVDELCRELVVRLTYLESQHVKLSKLDAELLRLLRKES